MNIPAVSLQAFTNETFIFMKQENDTGKRAARICQEHHFHPRVLFELDQQMTSYNVTCSGMGISFIGDLLDLPGSAESECRLLSTGRKRQLA